MVASSVSLMSNTIALWENSSINLDLLIKYAKGARSMGVRRGGTGGGGGAGGLVFSSDISLRNR